MKILKRLAMKDGVKIQLEDWDGKLSIGAYPIAKNGNWLTRSGEHFRLTIYYQNAYLRA